MLKLENVDFAYSSKRNLIENFNMTLGRGSICGLLGKNGAGKTTLIYLICGLLKPKKGEISFNGYNPFERDPKCIQDIFLIPEEFRLPNITMDRYVDVNAPFYPRFDEGKLDRYLDIFELERNVNLGKLSMGQKKKAFLSFGMACNTPLLILDEPTNGLDIGSKRGFRRAVTECMTDDKSILISTHQVYDVEKILDHVIITDKQGVMLNSSMTGIMEKLRFNFTTDRKRAEEALIALDVPGGYNIAEKLENPAQETEVNLETLFELVQTRKNMNLF